MANSLLLSSLALSLVFILGVYSDDITNYDGYSVYRLIPTTFNQLRYLHELEENNFELDFWRPARALNESVDVMVPPHFKHMFEVDFFKKSFQQQTIIEDVEKVLAVERMAQRSSLRNSTRAISDQYNRLADIHSFLDSTASANPTIARVETIGTSYQGRALKLIRIGVNVANNKPVIFVDGGIHAREWISPAFVICLAEYLVDQYKANNADVVALLTKFNWILLPVVNPDGYEYSHTTTRLWRKTRRPSSSSPSCIGADPNRNFAYQWGGEGASSNACSETYRGDSSFSEPETKALSDFLTSIKSSLKAYLTVHSYGQYWLYPWGYTSALTPDDADLKRMGNLAVAALTATHGTRYTVGTSTNVLYAAAGGSDDWAYGAANCKYSYTVELRDTGTYGFQLPVGQIKHTCTETIAAFIEFGKNLSNEV